jgi:hypothetical protein
MMEHHFKIAEKQDDERNKLLRKIATGDRAGIPVVPSRA